MPENFGDFTQESTPDTGEFLVGYSTAVAGGERRYAVGDISGLIDAEGAQTALSGVIADVGSWDLSGVNYPNLLQVSGSGSILTSMASTGLLTIGHTGFTPGGSNTYIQFNEGGLLGANENFRWISAADATPTGNILYVSGLLSGHSFSGQQISGGTGSFTGSLTLNGSGVSVLTGATDLKAAGSSGQLQYNDGDNFGASDALSFESNRLYVNDSVQVGTGTWNTGEFLFMASGTGIYMNYFALPTADPTSRGQIYRSGSALHISAG
jgi:hypothetical protein